MNQPRQCSQYPSLLAHTKNPVFQNPTRTQDFLPLRGTLTPNRWAQFSPYFLLHHIEWWTSFLSFHPVSQWKSRYPTQYFLPNRSPHHAFGKLNVCACDFHYTDSTNSIHPSPLKEWKSDENLDTKPNNPWPIKRLLRWTVIPSCKETDRTLMLFFHLWPLLRTLDPKQHLETKISLDCKLSDPSRIFL